MKYVYSRARQCAYLVAVTSDIPADAVPLTVDRYNSVIANPDPGKVRSHDVDGLPILIDPPPHVPTVDELCANVDVAADAARHKVAGDPLRAEEYKAAASEAAAFADANYQGAVPPMVAAWVTPNRNAQQAADDILAEANAYNTALVQLRTARLQAKEQIRALMAADEVEQAQAVANQTVAAIEAAVAGIGNNA